MVISMAAPILGAWYDSAGTFITGISNGSPAAQIPNYMLAVPNNASKCVINAKVGADIDPVVITYKGGKPLSETDVITNDYKNKKYITFGDSITWYNDNGRIGYQTLMKAKLGLNSYQNEGVSGASISTASSSHSYTPIVTKVLTYASGSLDNYDLVSVFGGTNDYTFNTPLGTLGTIGDSNFDNTTFYGAYRTIIEHILDLKPTIRLILINPLQRNRDGLNSWTTQNTAGHTLKDYADAVKNVAELYGLPVVDLFYESGFNSQTLSTYTSDGLHPNNTGYVRLANCIMGKLVQCGK